jgi:nitrogen-specific signal transduction histidine kinase
MSTSHTKLLDWPDTMQIISSKKIGVGLVLATVYQIIIRNEGTLGLKITLGERTSFTVFLPDLETSLSLASN